MVANLTLLVGAEQSGTTLLRLMLDSHPEIAFAEEFEYAVEPIGADGSYPSMASYHRYLETSRAYSTSGFSFDPGLSFPDLINGFLRSRQEQKNAPAVGATLHHGVSKALRLWPDAKFIHLVRDPRDVGPARVSEGLAGNIWYGLDSWIETEDEWAMIENTIDPARVLTVRFADLIRDYHSTLHEICRFIGVDYTAQMLDYAADTDYRAPSANVAGDWRDSLSARDVRLAESRVGDRLTRLGFQPSGLDPVAPSGRQRSMLRWQDRFGRVTVRIEHFGLRLTVAELLARALKNQPMQNSVQARLDETQKARRKKSWSESAKYRTSQ
ncbi:MAG: sulfotransferase family protein [Acidimicrobiales bacterium]